MSIDTRDRARVPAGVHTGGQFATEAREEADVSLASALPQPSEAATRHWSGDANERRAGEVIARMDGVDAVKFDDGVHPVSTGHGTRDFGKTGTITYKGHRFPFDIYEGLGSVSGSGWISVKDASGREIGHATYSIPKTDGGRASVARDDLGENIEASILAVRLRNALRGDDVSFGGDLARLADRVHTTGGKAWIVLHGRDWGDSDLYFHGGRVWRGHGGPAYGSKAHQQDVVVKALGGGDLRRGKKVLARLDEVMKRAQAEHDAEYPPTAEQARRRRRV